MNMIAIDSQIELEQAGNDVRSTIHHRRHAVPWPSTREDLLLAWLSSERDAPPARPGGRKLIDKPRLADPGQNQARKDLLDRDRGKLLPEIPDSAQHLQAQIEEADLPGLHVVPSRE